MISRLEPRRRRRSAPQPVVQLAVNLSPDLHQQFRTFCRVNEITMAECVRRWIEIICQDPPSSRESKRGERAFATEA